MPIKNHLAWRGKPLAHIIQPMTYDRLFNSTSVKAGMPKRYPVFIRFENDHKGSRSPLLHDKDELLAAIYELEAQGMNRESMMIIEYINTADETGTYRKYSHFYVDGEVIARHLFQGEKWMLKVPGKLDATALAEERNFVESNPYREEIGRIFRIARIDYGRIDFTVSNNRILVW